MPQFTVVWCEKVFDANGDLECVYPQEAIALNVATLAEAKEAGRLKCQAVIAAARPDQSNGYFIPNIKHIVDEQGIHHAC